MTDDRLRLRGTFNSAADLYHRARPDYPRQLFDALVQAARLQPDDRLLEVGCATGKATLPLAQRGFRITCIELGGDLATAAKANLADFADVEVIERAFEDWQPPAGERFDLVFAATAWHWLDPAVRYRHTWERLRPGGHLAIWRADHVFPHGGDPFFAEIQDIFDWEVTYDADSYLRLLHTFSGHIAMKAWQRDRVYGEIRRRLAERTDGRLRRHWGAVLQIARRADPSFVL